jgi:hypothetical protein
MSDQVKLILHIGEGKTGTTSIQQHLFDNRKWLAGLGVLYLTPPAAVNHVCLAARLGLKVRVSKENLEVMHGECDLLFDQLKLLAESSETKAIVISVEHLFTANSDVVLSYLSNYFDVNSIHVIAYIRDPVGQYVSRMQQRIKASYLIVPPHRYARDVFSPVKKWVDQLGLDKVHVKPFSRASLISSDVLVDFLSQLSSIAGATLSAPGHEPANVDAARSNSGINVEQMSTVQCFRRIVYPDANNILQRRSSRMVAFFEGLNEKGQLGTKPKMKPDISAAILANNAPFFDSLATLYPRFTTIQASLGLSGIDEESAEWNGQRQTYISIVDLFVDRSVPVLNLYRFLCIPFRAPSKAPRKYMSALAGYLDRCDCSAEVSRYVVQHAEKVVAHSIEKELPQVQMF